MTDTERKEAIKEVLKWVKSGKQDLQNGADEIETINCLYRQEQVNVTLGSVSGCWISQKDKDIMTYHAGSTLLVRFEDSDIGITSDDGSTVDVSWFRTPSKDQVHTTSGSFSRKMIRDYKLIE